MWCYWYFWWICKNLKKPVRQAPKLLHSGHWSRQWTAAFCYPDWCTMATDTPISQETEKSIYWIVWIDSCQVNFQVISSLCLCFRTPLRKTIINLPVTVFCCSFTSTPWLNRNEGVSDPSTSFNNSTAIQVEQYSMPLPEILCKRKCFLFLWYYLAALLKG